MKRTRAGVAKMCLKLCVLTGMWTGTVWAQELQNGEMECPTGFDVAPGWTGYRHHSDNGIFDKATSPIHGGNTSQKIKAQDVNNAEQGIRQLISCQIGDAITVVGYIYPTASTYYASARLGLRLDGSTDLPFTSGLVADSYWSNPAGTRNTWNYVAGWGKATGTNVCVFLDVKRLKPSDTTSYFDDFVSYHAYLPPEPTINNATPNSLDVNVNPGGNSGNSGAQFAITIGGGAYTTGTHWVQANGTVDTATIWQTDAEWGTKTVTGLAPNTTYTFKIKARYNSVVALATELGPDGANSTGPLILQTAESRKTHGVAGSYDIALPLDTASPAVESRDGGPTKLVLTFSRPIYAVDDSWVDLDEVSVTAGSVMGVSVDGSQMTIDMVDVPNTSCLTVTLSSGSIRDEDSNLLLGDHDFQIRCLIGDVTDPYGNVNAADASPSTYQNMVLDLDHKDNAKFDLNLDGVIDVLDSVIASFQLCTSSCQ